MTQITVLIFTIGLVASLNGLFQYVVISSKIKKLEKELPRLKSLTSLLSFKKFLDVVSADEAQELLEELMVGLRTQPSLDVMSTFVEEKLQNLKGNLKALLDALSITDVINLLFSKIKHSYSTGIVLNVIALTSLILVFIRQVSLFFLGLSLGFEIDSLLFLFYTLYYMDKIEKVKNTLRKYLNV